MKISFTKQLSVGLVNIDVTEGSDEMDVMEVELPSGEKATLIANLNSFKSTTNLPDILPASDWYAIISEYLNEHANQLRRLD